MAGYRQRGIGYAVFLVIALCSVGARAGLNDALDGMWMSNATGGGVYDTSTRTGFIGGSISLRAPVRNFQVIAYDPPRFNAGCGGIDMFMGSFSFVSGEQFTQMLRNIATAAAGYFFQLAINQMCSPCHAVMAKLQELSTVLNNGQLNSCRVGQYLAGQAAAAVGSDGNRSLAAEHAESLDTFRNQAGSWFASLQDMFKAPQSTIKANASDNPNVGNLVWRALYRSGAASMVGDPAINGVGLDQSNMAMYIMSLVGTFILPLNDDDGTNTSPAPPPYLPTIEFQDLITGADTPQGQRSGKLRYQCDDTSSELSCLHLNTVPFDFPGTRSYVYLKLFGTADGSDNPAAGSIVDKIAKGTPLSPEDSHFLSVFQVPARTLLMDVQKDPAAIRVLALEMAPILAEEMAVYLASAMLKAIRAAYSTTNAAALPKPVEASMKQLQEALLRYARRAPEDIELINAMAQNVSNIRKYLPGMLYSPPR